MEFKLIPRNDKMSFSWVLLIAQPTQGLIMRCADYTSSFSPASPPLPLLYSLLFKHFITVLHLGQKNAKGLQKRGESAQPFLLWMLERPGGGEGCSNLVKINVSCYLGVYNCPYHGGSKEWLTQGDDGDSESRSPSIDARVATTRAPSRGGHYF